MIRKFLKSILGENLTENNEKLATINFGIILLMFVISGVMFFSCQIRFPFCIMGLQIIQYPVY